MNNFLCYRQSLNTISLESPNTPLCLGDMLTDFCESVCKRYCDVIHTGVEPDAVFSEMCRRPVTEHVGFPVDLKDKVPQLVDDVCLPLQRLSIFPCLPVLEAFLQLSKTFRQNLISPNRVGQFQPSTFVIKGMSSNLTKMACMEYVRLAHERTKLGPHGKLDPSVALFFHGQDSAFVHGSRCILADLGDVIQAVRDQKESEFDIFQKNEPNSGNVGSAWRQ